jgi:hypothetical protein
LGCDHVPGPKIRDRYATGRAYRARGAHWGSRRHSDRFSVASLFVLWSWGCFIRSTENGRFQRRNRGCFDSIRLSESAPAML